MTTRGRPPPRQMEHRRAVCDTGARLSCATLTSLSGSAMSKELSEYKPVYLIYGEQELLLDQALAQLKSKVGKIADLDFNSDTFDGESASADDIVAACNTLPFASERRLVIVKNVDQLSKDGLDRLLAYINNPAETTILALVAKKIAKNTKLYKAVDKLGGLLAREAPGKAEWPKATRDMFARRGRELPVDAAELLVTLTGRNLRALSAGMEKVIAYAGERTALTREDIEAVVVRTAEMKVFDVPNALAERDCAATLRLLDRWLSSGETVYGVWALCLRTIRDLIAARAMIERGEGSAAQLGVALGRPEWMVRDLIRQAKAFGPGHLVDVLGAAADVEAQMKTSRDPRLAFERWIVKVCA